MSVGWLISALGVTILLWVAHYGDAEEEDEILLWLMGLPLWKILMLRAFIVGGFFLILFGLALAATRPLNL